MDKTMTPHQAWKDFYEWFHGSEKWHDLSEDNRQYLRKTNRDVTAENCGAQRIKNALGKYASERYEFVDLSGFKRICPRCGGSGIDPYPGHSTTVPPCPDCQ